MRRPLVLFNFQSPAAGSGQPSGIPYFLFSMIRAMADLDRCSIGLCTSWKREHVPPDVLARLAVFHHRSIYRPRVLDVFAQAVSISAFARRVGADVVINADPLGTPAGGRRRITFVHDLYAAAVPHSRALHERLTYRVIMNAVLGASHRVICVSDTTRSDLERFFPRFAGKAIRIYEDGALLGLPVAQVKGDVTLSPAGGGYVMFIGNLVPTKNIGRFYEALDLLAERGHHPRTIVVGRDPQGLARDAEKRVRKARKPERFENLDEQTLCQLLSGALCLVNTSTYEGFCLPILDAQRAGIPVICPRRGATAEIAGEGALLIDPEDPADIAAAMERVLSSAELRASLTERGRVNASRFSWESSARALQDEVDALVASW